MGSETSLCSQMSPCPRPHERNTGYLPVKSRLSEADACVEPSWDCLCPLRAVFSQTSDPLRREACKPHLIALLLTVVRLPIVSYISTSFATELFSVLCRPFAPLIFSFPVFSSHDLQKSHPSICCFHARSSTRPSPSDSKYMCRIERGWHPCRRTRISFNCLYGFFMHRVCLLCACT